MEIAPPLTRAAMSNIATNNKVLLQLAEHRKLMREIVRLLQKQTDPNATLTVSDFCVGEKISRAYFYDLQKHGRGPRLMRLANGAVRISAEARREWRRAREAETAENNEPGP
jgi:hypothetical protein